MDDRLTFLQGIVGGDLTDDGDRLVLQDWNFHCGFLRFGQVRFWVDPTTNRVTTNATQLAYQQAASKANTPASTRHMHLYPA
jgi:hypothetical protein